MAESKGALIAKSVQKHAGRAKEKLLQNLGKVDRTLDDIFEEHLQNFNRQHQQATRLQKEFNNYIRCIRAVQTASKSLMEAITEAYESGWSGHDLLYVQAQNMEMLWQDFSHKLGDQVLIPLNTYTNQFPEVRELSHKLGDQVLIPLNTYTNQFPEVREFPHKLGHQVLIPLNTYTNQFPEVRDFSHKLGDQVLIPLNTYTNQFPEVRDMEILWQELSHKLGDQVLIPLNTYTNQFPEVRKKIEKRGRKLVDYDSQRHSFQNLQANAAKRRDDVKVTKGREQLEEAKRTYEVLNSELHDELPALYDSRVLFYVNNLQTLFSAEQLFHSESAKVYSELEAITDKLATESQRGSYTKKVVSNNVASSPHTNGNAASPNSPTGTVQTPPVSPRAVNGDSTPPPYTPPRDDSPATPPSEQATPPRDVAETNNNGHKEDDKKVEELYDIPAGSPTAVPDAEKAPEKVERSKDQDKTNAQDKNKNGTDEKEKDKPVDEPDSPQKEEKSDDVYDIPVGATLAGLPPGTLYRVRATYRYTREDSDELSFDVGDTIRVVEYDDPDEQEEGWLMGIKEGTNEKGMFPANFTRPI
ncbi:BAR domain-containing protein [Phthorimaea operculella]|nr:BAR domain-containing protein [Phthorimaea operculella]